MKVKKYRCYLNNHELFRQGGQSGSGEENNQNSLGQVSEDNFVRRKILDGVKPWPKLLKNAAPLKVNDFQ